MITLENITTNPTQLAIAQQLFTTQKLEEIAHAELLQRRNALANLTNQYAASTAEEQRLSKAHSMSTTQSREQAKRAVAKSLEAIAATRETKSQSIIGRILLKVAPALELKRENESYARAVTYERDLETHIAELDNKIAGLKKQNVQLDSALTQAREAVSTFETNDDVRGEYITSKVMQQVTTVQVDYQKALEFFPPLTSPLQDRTAVLKEILERLPSEKKKAYFADIETRAKEMQPIVQSQIRETLIAYLKKDASITASTQLIKMGEMESGAQIIHSLNYDYANQIPEDITIQVANYFISKGETRAGVQVLAKHKNEFLKYPGKSLEMLKDSLAAVQNYVAIYKKSHTNIGRVYGTDAYHEPGEAMKALGDALAKRGFNELALESYDAASSYFTTCGCSDLAMNAIGKLPKDDSRHNSAKRVLMYNKISKDSGCNYSLGATLAVELEDKDAILQLAPRIYHRKKAYNQFGSEWNEFMNFAQKSNDNEFLARMYEIGEDPANAMKYRNIIAQNSSEQK